MKKTTISIFLLAAMAAMGGAQASEFGGGYVGASVGNNNSDISGPLAASGKSTMTYGVSGGYNWDLQNFLLGVEAFADSNNKSGHSTAVAPFSRNYGSNVYGADVKLGLPQGRWMPYARFGYAQTNGTDQASAISGGDVHGGLGVEYKFTPNWGMNAEWTRSSAKSNGSKLVNDNVSVGVLYFFGAPAAPAVEPVAAQAAPAAAPAPEQAAPAAAAAPQETWKTVTTEQVVRLEGANFATNSAKLLKTADAKLEQVVKAAAQYPAVKFEVSGHTDSTGRKAFNQKLSEHRAASVKAWLVKHGVAAERMSTAGYAATRPIADNKTKAGRAANRRVEVRYVIEEEKKVRVSE